MKKICFSVPLLLAVACTATMVLTMPDFALAASGAGDAASSQQQLKPHLVGHSDPFASILLQFGLVIVAAMLGRWGAKALDQPSVLGELLIGVLLGNILYWLNQPLAIIIMHLSEATEIFQAIWHHAGTLDDLFSRLFSAEQMAPGGVGEKMKMAISQEKGAGYVVLGISLWIFSNLGVILLLFMVGLDSSVDEMLRVGPKAIVVAILGVIVPFALGFLLSLALLPGATTVVHLFIGATLTATSVGITARVFKDMKLIRSREAKLVLGAAVVDDILGLIVLAIVVGIVVTGGLQWMAVAKTLMLSMTFMAAVFFIGLRIAPRMPAIIKGLDRSNVSLLFPLVMSFVFAFTADMIGLAAIIGAFAAGLIIDKCELEKNSAFGHSADHIFGPLEALFAPVFFVFMGMQVNLAVSFNPSTLWLALGFIIVAVVGKLISGLAAGRTMNRMAVGMGMVPRGEVGLIFASIGKGLGAISDEVFSAVVAMVIVTTLIAPIGLKWALERKSHAEH